MCSITGSHMRSVALDEAHEMCVNKDLKTTIVRPTTEFLDRILYYYPVRSQALKTLKKQLCMDSSKSKFSTTQFDNSLPVVKLEDNITVLGYWISMLREQSSVFHA